MGEMLVCINLLNSSYLLVLPYPTEILGDQSFVLLVSHSPAGKSTKTAIILCYKGCIIAV